MYEMETALNAEMEENVQTSLEGYEQWAQYQEDLESYPEGFEEDFFDEANDFDDWEYDLEDEYVYVDSATLRSYTNMILDRQIA